MLYIPACASKARRTLALSTATGYAAMYPAKACEAFNGPVVSLENDSAMAAGAQKNFQKAGIVHFFDKFGKTLIWPQKSTKNTKVKFHTI